MANNEQTIQEGKFFAVISYISFLCIVSLVLRKNNEFALFHAKQGLVIFVMEVACFMLTIIPIFWLIRTLFFLFFVIVSVIGILQAYAGSTKGLPIISNIAQKVVL